MKEMRYKYKGKKAGVGSGLSSQESFHETSPDAMGMGATEKNQKPKANPKNTVKTDHGTFRGG